MNKLLIVPPLLVVFMAGAAWPAIANGLPDRDRDGVPDRDEEGVYYTNPDSPDTDGDGYSDRLELTHGYSPHNTFPVKLDQNDQDKDGLTDRMELKFKTNLLKDDSDGDGFKDGEEIGAGYDPNRGSAAKLVKRIEIDIKAQRLRTYLADVRLADYPVSSGVGGSTPTGTYTVTNKDPKAWSPYGLWMPYWLGLDSGRFGIHELPIWPNGYTEGEGKLGTPASHGCIRVGKDAAKALYDWTPVGTKVVIH